MLIPSQKDVTTYHTSYRKIENIYETYKMFYTWYVRTINERSEMVYRYKASCYEVVVEVHLTRCDCDMVKINEWMDPVMHCTDIFKKT